MKHFWAGFGILFLFLVLSVGITLSMDKHHSQTESILYQAADAALAEDTQQAVSYGRQAKELWDKGRKFTASVADHGPMDEIECLFAEMEVYGQSGEMPHFAACCRQLAVMVKAMGDAHSLTWWNLL